MSHSASIRIVVIDDHAMVREALIGLLQRQPGVVVCGEADSLDRGIAAVNEYRPGLVLTDLMLHGRDGLDLVRYVHTLHPAIKVMVITMKEDVTFAAKAKMAGAVGFIMKDRITEDLTPAIEAIRNGGTWYPEHTG